MKSFFDKYRFWISCWRIVFVALSLCFSFYLVTFFLGNHDWQYIRFGAPLGADVWEARPTQFVLPYVLFSGYTLPILGSLVGFIFFVTAVIILAKWYALPQKKAMIVIFSLLIVLHPYVCSQLYYTYLVPSLLLWHFCCVTGVVALWEFVNRRRYFLLLTAVALLLTAMCGYAACLELIVTIIIGKFLMDVSAQKKINVNFFKKYICFWGLMVIVLLLYGGVISVLKKLGAVNTGMYNTQILPADGVMHKFFENWQQPFSVLTKKMPYVDMWVSVCFWGLFLLSLLSMKRNKILCAVGFVCLLYALFCVAYISPYDVFNMFRIHVYSVPFGVAVLFAFVGKNGKTPCLNAAFVLSCVLIFWFIKADVTTQKIWYLGNKQDEMAVERMKNDLLPELKKGKHYRLSTIGNLYGREKFAEVISGSEQEREIYREYWGAPYFVPIFFSAGFWGYEAENPIWGDAMYIKEDIFYGTSNENISLEDIIKARIFAMYFGDDKKDLNLLLRKLKPFPQKPYYIIGRKDIFLMMDNNNAHKANLLNKMRNQSAY